MDYGLFRRFEKIDVTKRFPRASQENGFFLVELHFASEGETRSVPVQLELERSGFGEVLRLHVVEAMTQLTPKTLVSLREGLKEAEPPIQLDASFDRLTLTFIDGEAKTKRVTSGALIFDGQDRICTIVARLRN